MTGEPAADELRRWRTEARTIGRLAGRRGGSRKWRKRVSRLSRQKKRLKVGHFIVEFATPGIGHIMKNCRLRLRAVRHGAFSGFGFETVKSALRYMQAADLPAIVRVPSKAYHHIARACDMGAEGVMLPMVGSADEAKKILRTHEILSRRRSRRGPAGGA